MLILKSFAAILRFSASKLRFFHGYTQIFRRHTQIVGMQTQIPAHSKSSPKATQTTIYKPKDASNNGEEGLRIITAIQLLKFG